MTPSTAEANAAGSAIVRGGSDGNVPLSPERYYESRSSPMDTTVVKMQGEAA